VGQLAYLLNDTTGVEPGIEDRDRGLGNRLRWSVIYAAGTRCSEWGIKKEDKGPIEFRAPIAYPSIRKALPQAYRLAIQDFLEK
jgi:hypothetical protein